MSEGVASVSATVREAFGVEGVAVPLGAGEGVTVRVGGVVLKRVHDVDEAEWAQALQARLSEDGFRLARPVPTVDGRWTHAGWSAAQFVPGLRPLAPDWQAVVAVGLRFSDAAEAVRDADAGVLAARTHRWAVADRCAWGEGQLDLASEAPEAPEAPEAAEVHERLTALLGDPPTARQVVHGDLSGNVHVDRSGTPVVLDFSPYLRPREWAAAVVIADAVLWNGAPLSLARSFASTRPGRDLLARALIFRMVADQLAATDRGHGAHLAPYRRVLAAFADDR
jgi:uncharacterized protein (TIGR02569 family)